MYDQTRLRLTAEDAESAENYGFMFSKYTETHFSVFSVFSAVLRLLALYSGEDAEDRFSRETRDDHARAHAQVSALRSARRACVMVPVEGALPSL